MNLQAMFELPIFSGKENEDVNSFISHFQRLADILEWPKEKQSKILPLCLRETANVWCNSLPNLNQMSIDELLTALKDYFLSSAIKYRLRQMLNERTQKEHETVSSYSVDIMKLCNCLNVPNNERMTHFITGLRLDIKEAVILHEPTSYQEAESFAKLKEVVSDNPRQLKSSDLVLEIKQEIIKQLNEEGVTTPNSHVEGRSSSCNFEHISTTPERCYCAAAPTVQSAMYRTEPIPDVRELIRQEIRNQFEDSNMYPSRNCCIYRKKRLYQRRTRTVIACNYCKKPGHVIDRCRYLKRKNQRINQRLYSQANYVKNFDEQDCDSTTIQENLPPSKTPLPENEKETPLKEEGIIGNMNSDVCALTKLNEDSEYLREEIEESASTESEKVISLAPTTEKQFAFVSSIRERLFAEYQKGQRTLERDKKSTDIEIHDASYTTKSSNQGNEIGNEKQTNQSDELKILQKTDALEEEEEEEEVEDEKEEEEEVKDEKEEEEEEEEEVEDEKEEEEDEEEVEDEKEEEEEEEEEIEEKEDDDDEEVENWKILNEAKPLYPCIKTLYPCRKTFKPFYPCRRSLINH